MKYLNFDNPIPIYFSSIVIGCFTLYSESIDPDFEEVGFKPTHILSNSLDKVFSFILFGLLALFIYIAYTILK